MNVLVVGGGGREHAIALALSKNPKVSSLYCIPGNGGISKIARCIDVKPTDVEFIVEFAKNVKIDFVVVAQDDPLALGMVDELNAVGIRAFGPTKDAAIIEGSKIFSKNLMEKYNIPTAKYRTFDGNVDAAIAYIREQGAPIVVKCDGLALGKGVIVAQTVEEAEEAVHTMMEYKKFGASGSRVVIEECMTGPEVTVLAFTDGKTILPMLSSQDHKRAFDGDEGPNTGGMGAFCPSPKYTDEIAQQCMDTIFKPTIDAMNAEGRPFKGVIYFGLMLTADGPKVIEYNARFGDPEAQPILTMLETDLLEICEAVVDERLDEITLTWKPGAACCVVMASGGYPTKYETGQVIHGLDEVDEDITVYHAGTKLRNHLYFTAGGRVLGVTATGETLSAAVKNAYKGVGQISFQDAHYRTDIGKK